MAEIEYTETDAEGLDKIASLWQKLNDLHGELSEHFSASYPKNTFLRRKQELLAKSSGGAMRLDLVRDKDTVNLIGYCVSTISKNGKGEIDSIYIEDSYRRSGIGDCLMKKALCWLKEKSADRVVVEVIVNNEAAFSFYRQYGFYLRSTILEQVKESGRDKG